jgi:hypothetical protein
MLLNEFLKEHHEVEQMQKQIDALTAGRQKSERTARSEQTCAAGGQQSLTRKR